MAYSKSGKPYTRSQKTTSGGAKGGFKRYSAVELRAFRAGKAAGLKKKAPTKAATRRYSAAGRRF